MHALWIVFLFIFGACAGSFLNVVVYRMPRDKSIVFPGSHCPICGKAILWHDNIPILSWLLLRGRCRWCKAPISPRYPLIELLAAVLVSGLYVCYFVLELRDGAGPFVSAWPMFAAHAVLLCGLLACSAVDIEQFIVPLPVTWFCSAAGIAAAAFRPHAFLPPVSAAWAAGALAACAGLGIAEGLLRLGFLQPSFLDADDRPSEAAGGGKGRPTTVAITAAHGVNPRREILRELVYLAPAIALAAAAVVVVKHVGPVGRVCQHLLSGGGAGAHVASGVTAVFGMLVGGAVIWGTRIGGTLLFGKEAMGMGDVHILAAVGATAGAGVAVLTFFAAPLFGLLWALYLLAARGRREIPYGPWLALGTLLVLLFYDAIMGFILPT